MYGYDWAKWVARDPARRDWVGPFDQEFLRYSRRRAGELFELIQRDDTRYPRLHDGGFRNPFGFSRQPAAETALFEDLAHDRLIPVEAWRIGAEPSWDRPFADLRLKRAERIEQEGSAPADPQKGDRESVRSDKART